MHGAEVKVDAIDVEGLDPLPVDPPEAGVVGRHGIQHALDPSCVAGGHPASQVHLVEGHIVAPSLVPVQMQHTDSHPAVGHGLDGGVRGVRHQVRIALLPVGDALADGVVVLPVVAHRDAPAVAVRETGLDAHGASQMPGEALGALRVGRYLTPDPRLGVAPQRRAVLEEHLHMVGEHVVSRQRRAHHPEVALVAQGLCSGQVLSPLPRLLPAPLQVGELCRAQTHAHLHILQFHRGPALRQRDLQVANQRALPEDPESLGQCQGAWLALRAARDRTDDESQLCVGAFLGLHGRGLGQIGAVPLAIDGYGGKPDTPLWVVDSELSGPV